MTVATKVGFARTDIAARTFDAAYVAEVEAAAYEEWAKDWSVGSGDDHCHTFTKAITGAKSKWSKKNADISGCWASGTDSERWAMAWSLAYRSAYRYASGHYSSARYAITFSKDIASAVVTELITKGTRIGSAVVAAYIKGMVNCRIKNSFRNATNDYDKACAWAWSKGFSDAKNGKVGGGGVEDESAAAEDAYEMGFDKSSIGWADDGAEAFGSDAVKADYSASDLAVSDGPYAELYSALGALKAYNEDWFEIVERVYCNGETEREVAKTRGISQKNVNKTKTKAIAWLKAAMAA